jgi:amino acid adenylation domain-containing protein
MAAQVEGFRLSPQQRFFYASDKEQRINQCEVSLTGRLDVLTLQNAIQKTVDRHEILRTTFHRLPGMSIPLQRVEKSSAIAFTAYDLRHLNGQEQEAEFHSISGREAKSPIDLQSGPVLRACLVSRLPEAHTLILTLPALCADRRSLENVSREISILYNAAGNDSFLEEPIQYADAASMLNQFAEADPSEPGKRFWSRQEIGKYLDSPIPYQAGTLLGAPHAQGSIAIEISSRLVEKLDSTCGRLQMSRKVFLLSCWQILFVRLGGELGFCTGVTFDGRGDEALRDAVGPYEKRLPLITQLQPEMTVKEVLLATNYMIEDLITWQDDFCCEQFVLDAEIQLPGATFGWCFDYYSRLDIAADGPLSCKLTKLISEADRFKVLLSIVESGSKLSAQLQYDPSSFEPEDVKRLSEQFQTLLADAIKNPDAGIMKLNVLPKSERAFLLRELNLTEREYTIDCCAHQLFERQVRRNPDAVAVVFNDQNLSYAELNAKSNQLARKLQKLDVGPEVKVGLCTQRTPEMLIGILGILKAGGAYVPLDPVLPSERLGYMLEDSQSQVLVASKGIELNVPQVEIPAIYLDSEGSEIKEESADNLSSEVKPSNLAYVIYTSGSTGKPKGVAIEHRQLVNYILASRERVGFNADSFALLSSVAADLGNTSLFGALCAGGSLHLISQEVALDGKELAAYFRRHPIDCVKITPSHLAGLIASGAADVLPHLRLVLGGESSHWASVEELQEFKPDCSIFNHYGPTETTIGCCLYSVPRSENRSGLVPIGNPLSNIQLYVLDQEGQPVPFKIAGELYIGGAGVGRGYLNNPALTAERYVPDEFSGRKGDRLYVTGDVVRWNREGELEFIGRRDKQVKIRGHRVELGEVESVLSTCPGVAQAAVLVEGDAAQTRLIAYIVGKHGQAATPLQLQQHLSHWLPAHMTPAAYVSIDQMPLLANGKIDRQALQQSEPGLSTRRAYQAARTPLEDVLCGIWAQVLEVERVGVEDNFFEMGGHSLLATQVISRIRDVLRVELPLRLLFESPTVEKLTLAIPEYEQTPGQAGKIATILKKVKQMSAKGVVTPS